MLYLRFPVSGYLLTVESDSSTTIETIHPAVFGESAADVPVLVHASRSVQLGVHVSLGADAVPHLLPSPNQPRVPPRDDSPVFESPFDNACGSQVSGVFNDSERLPRVLSAVHY